MGHFRAHVAVHEGGHAVVALALGLEVVEISLCGGDDTELKFFTRYGAPAPDLLRANPDATGPTLLAGTCAENLILGGHIWGGYDGDAAIIREVYRRRPNYLELTSDEVKAETQRFLVPWLALARALVREHRAVIETVAHELLIETRLTGEQIVDLRDRAVSRPSTLPTWALTG